MLIHKQQCVEIQKIQKCRYMRNSEKTGFINSFIIEWKETSLYYNVGWNKLWQHDFHVNNKLTSLRPVNCHCRTSAYLPLAVHAPQSAFLLLFRETYLQFFLTLFWQNIFSKEVWRNVKSDMVRVFPVLSVLWYTLYHSPKRFIRCSDIAHFIMRKSPY